MEYREQIVALRDSEAGTVALRETELEAGTVEGAFEPVGKYHVSCYEAMLSEVSGDWPESPQRLEPISADNRFSSKAAVQQNCPSATSTPLNIDATLRNTTIECPRRPRRATASLAVSGEQQ